jgi:hypothetical protein
LIIPITILVKSPYYALSFILSQVQILFYISCSQIQYGYKSDCKSSQQKIHNVSFQIRTFTLFDRCVTLGTKLGQNTEMAEPSKMLVNTSRLYSFMNLTAPIHSKFQSSLQSVHKKTKSYNEQQSTFSDFKMSLFPINLSKHNWTIFAKCANHCCNQ